MRISLAETEDRLERLKTCIEKHITHIEDQQTSVVDGEQKYVIFLSVGNPNIRAKVLKACSNRLIKSWQNVKRATLSLVHKKHLDPQWIKIDVVTEINEWPFQELEKHLRTVKRNYFREGISFDKDFRLAFLEQEINGYALIRSKQNGPLALDAKNINNYLNDNFNGHKFPFMKQLYLNKTVYTFKTIGFFDDREEIYELYNGELTNGIRKVNDIEEEIQSLITKTTYFLVNQIGENGQFEYGYFPCFAKKIGTYNILRHASTLYAMAEGYELIQDEKILTAIERGIDYLINEAIVHRQDRAYVVDYANDGEIKLGSNAHAILALTKLMSVTDDEKYLPVARALARTILEMQTDDGGFQHVLQYPSFELKDAFRTIYYDGEAVFALLRLYDLDRSDMWLEAIKKSFDHFIANDYWKYHDHWLSYAANEITSYIPEDRYFIFGLKNCQDRLSFIYNRNTTYPTFLELTMAAYKMVNKIMKLNKEYLFEYVDKDFLIETIDKRAEYQRVGFCYPELAMYFKNPALVLDGFFIRHHAFRVRIDDIEHNLSGYVHYLTYRVPELKSSRDLTLAGV